MGVWWGWGHCPERGSSVIKGHQWGGDLELAKALSRSLENSHQGQRPQRRPPSYESSAHPAVGSVRPQAVCPWPRALSKGLMGAGRYVHPQDPAKARWLVGSSALLSGLLLFLLLPPLLFSHVEGWSYVEGFYFSFVTLSTVGFGDYVIGENPQREAGGAPSTHQPIVRVPGHLLRARPCKGLGPKVQRTRALAGSACLCGVVGLRSPS